MTAYTFDSEDCPERRYHADDFAGVTNGQPTLSSSIARVLLASARNAWALHPKLGNLREKTPWMERTKAKRQGSIMHALMLECMDEFAIAPDKCGDWRTKEAREFRDDALDRGLMPILQSELEQAQVTARTLRSALLDRGIDLGQGDTERTIVHGVGVERGPIWIRTRLDHVVMDGAVVITDLKTHTGSFEDGALLRVIDRYGYHIQQAAYVEAAEAACPRMVGRVRFQFAFLQLSPVPDVRVVRLDGAISEVGERLWHRAKELWAQCLYTNTWPGYGHEISTIYAEPWFAARHNL